MFHASQENTRRMAKKSNTPGKPTDGKGKDTNTAKPQKKKTTERDADSRRTRPSRRAYSFFVASIPSERQEKQMRGIFAWLARLRCG